MIDKRGTEAGLTERAEFEGKVRVCHADLAGLFRETSLAERVWIDRSHDFETGVMDA